MARRLHGQALSFERVLHQGQRAHWGLVRKAERHGDRGLARASAFTCASANDRFTFASPVMISARVASYVKASFSVSTPQAVVRHREALPWGHAWVNDFAFVEPKTDVFKDLIEEGHFEQSWAARHNQEIWGTGPCGMYDAAPSGAQTGGALKQQQ